MITIAIVVTKAAVATTAISECDNSLGAQKKEG